MRTTIATSSQCARRAARFRSATTSTTASSVAKIAQMIQFATVEVLPPGRSRIRLDDEDGNQGQRRSENDGL